MGAKTVVLNRQAATAEFFSQRGAVVVSSCGAIRKEVCIAKEDTLWISYNKALTTALLKSIDWPTGPLGHIVLAHKPMPKSLPVLGNCFRPVVSNPNGLFLPPRELSEVLSTGKKEDLFIGGTVDEASRTMTLWRGNLASLTVPFTAFEPSGDGTKPDFSSFSVTDYGQTVRLGEYEAATEALLYEFDRSYRRRMARERRATAKSFGASLRRLRLQRKLRREDFQPLSAKTIARIEQGRVKQSQIRRQTLESIAKRLAVPPAEIGSY